MTGRIDSVRSDTAGASFTDLVWAEFEAQRDTSRAAHLKEIRKAFVDRNGPIIYSRFGRNIPCGVALTDNKAAAERNLDTLRQLEKSGGEQPELNGSGGEKRGNKPPRIPRWQRHLLRRERNLLLTEQRKPVHLHLVPPEPTPTTTPVLGTLSKCKTQAVYAGRFLLDEDLRQCLTLLYWPTDALIARADANTAGQPPDQSAASGPPDPSQPATPVHAQGTAINDLSSDQLTDVVKQQLEAADQYYQHFSQRTTRMAYFQGILYGMVGVTALFVLLYVFRGFTMAPTALLWSIMAGALGALTSILSSATFGKIVLDRAAGGNWNRFLGAFRPIIGALFGAAFYVLINAGFLPVKIPSGSSVALYASIAFLAGFSHRWAQDTFKSAEGRIPAPSRAPGGAAEQDTALKPD